MLDHAATFGPYGVVVVTDAGMVYLLTETGHGMWQWQLPTRPMCPPTGGRDALYVSCNDGVTYALADEEVDPIWTADASWTERGIGFADGLVLLAAGGQLQALNRDSGDQYWSHEIGDWRHTAPVYGRDTVFVGGDRLHALDPTPGAVQTAAPPCDSNGSLRGASVLVQFSTTAHSTSSPKSRQKSTHCSPSSEYTNSPYLLRLSSLPT